MKKIIIEDILIPIWLYGTVFFIGKDAGSGGDTFPFFFLAWPIAAVKIFIERIFL